MLLLCCKASLGEKRGDKPNTSFGYENRLDNVIFSENDVCNFEEGWGEDSFLAKTNLAFKLHMYCTVMTLLDSDEKSEFSSYPGAVDIRQLSV